MAERPKKGPIPDDGYNPFVLREVKHPTTDLDTIIHLIKGSLGSGILAMPMAFANIGLWFGIFATVFVAFICSYCIHILVKCAHILSYRRRIPMLSYADVAEQAFLDGGPKLASWAKFMRHSVSSFLCVDLLGCCAIYLVLVASSVKQVADEHNVVINVRLWILIITVPLIFMCLVRNLKYIMPFSLIANILMLVGILICFTYIFTDIPSPSGREAVADITKWPLFFGTVVFAIECIGVVMSLENDMETPTHFTGCPSVLSIGMSFITILYTVLGFFGYLKYGAGCKGSVTLNLPNDEKLATASKMLVATAIFCTFTLQFYVPVSIIWRGIRDRFPEERQDMAHYALRVALVLMCCFIAAALPNLGPFISLVGAVCLSVLGMILPAIIELAVYNEYPGYGRFNWYIYKNAFLIIFGVIGFITGTYISILEFRAEFLKEAEEAKSMLRNILP